MKSKYVGINLKNREREKRDHVWGTYREVHLGPDVMSKVIRFYEGGETSLHRHPVDELVVVELGEVSFSKGKNPKKLETKTYKSGELLFSPAGTWHSTGCVRKINEELPFALGIEYQFGKVNLGKYPVERFNNAKPTTAKLI